MFSTALRKGLFQGRTLQTPLMAPCSMVSQTALLGMAPSAGFAKYQRNKPHLNVGTIGKYSIVDLALNAPSPMLTLPLCRSY